MEYIQLLIDYFWQILSIGFSPVAAFAATQIYKSSRKPKPSSGKIVLFAFAVTFILAFVAWANAGTIGEAATVAAYIAFLQPLIVWVYFKIVEKRYPKVAEQLKGQNGELTIIPWVKKKDV